MAKKKFDEEEGVWRTIGGRRVFIKTGQSVSDAMKESGKFKKKNDKVETEETTKTKQKEDFDKWYKDFNDWTSEEYGDKSEQKKDFNKWYKDFDKQIDEEFGLDKEEKLKKDKSTGNEKFDKWYNDFDKWSEEEYSGKKKDDTKSWRQKLDTEEGRKEIFDKELDKSTRDKMYDFYKDSEKETKRSGNDFLPKATKITSQGKSNRKEVSDNIQAHILEHYDNPVDFMEQMDAMDYYPTKWHAGQELAKGGSYLIYNGDMADFLNSLGINPKGKKFSDEKSFEMYTSLVGRESERLYDKLEKLYKQYQQEHKDSDVSLDDFRKWFK